jgi:pimeloyl-ACP methyl ester carboxylesterase
MDFAFQVGIEHLHAEPDLNYNLNRMILLGGAPGNEVRESANRIRTLADWSREFLCLGSLAETQGRFLHASTYFRASEFFMMQGNPDKRPTFEKSVELFRRAARKDFDDGVVEPHMVPYEGAFLPAWRLPADSSKGTVVLHGGFDSCMEELYPLADRLRSRGYDLVQFEGPGQGSALRLQGLKMTPWWEKPIGAVLHYFELDEVTLVGISLGGYLAPRAAAFERRVKRVVAWDVMYDFFELMAQANGKAIEVALKALMALRAAPLVNLAVNLKMRKNNFMQWGIRHGMFVMGGETPYEYFKRAKLYTMKGISHRIAQDFLLLAGTDDHFQPLDWFFTQARELSNVRSFTGRVFTRAENGQAHCQMGNLDLALSFICNWIEQHSRPGDVQTQ